MVDSEMFDALREAVERELEPGSRFSGSECHGGFFAPATTGAFLFGLPWTAFSLFWMAASTVIVFKVEHEEKIFRFFPLFGLPFVLVGLAMLSSPIWVYRRSGKTAYLISDRRAMIFTGGRTTTIRSFAPSDLTEIYRKEKKDGSGDVLFHRRQWRDSDGDQRSEEIGFLRVENAKEVEQRLKELAASSSDAA